MRPSSHPSRCRGNPQPGAADTDGAVLRVAERRKRSTARSTAAEDRKSALFWARRSAGAGVAKLAASCSTYSTSGRTELRQLSAERPPRAGRAVAGAYLQLPCNRPSPARHWGRLGQRRSRDEQPLERVLEIAGPAASPNRLPLCSWRTATLLSLRSRSCG